MVFSVEVSCCNVWAPSFTVEMVTGSGAGNSVDVSGSKYTHRSSGTVPFVLENHEWYWLGPSRIMSLTDVVAITATSSSEVFGAVGNLISIKYSERNRSLYLCNAK